jgi:C-terminal processing protease CtpA/Prc
MTGFVVSALLLAPASPVPAAPPPREKVGEVDRFQSQNFARTVYNLADQVAVLYVVEKKDHVRELMAAAVRGLYEEAGQGVPESVSGALARATSATQLVELLADARVALGNHPNLSGAKSLFAAVNGFKYATDPICGLYSSRVNTYASVDQDFGVGIELEGVVGTRWALYQVEHGVASGRYGVPGWFGQVPRPETIPSPAGLPWRVKRVVPGSPAQKAGVKPGDVITHLDGREITADNANRMFSVFAYPSGAIDPNTGNPLIPERTLTFRRGDRKPFPVLLKAEGYTPESAFGVMRTADGWDCMLDARYKIGYIRLGPIEMGLDARVAEMMEQLAKRGCRALVLDLRWCPGGYVNPGTAIAGMFLKDGSVIAKMEYRNPAQAGSDTEVRTPPGGGTYANLPLVLLVGHETTGGGELIASALRDNDRCVIVGQRSVGRASIQNARPAGFAEVQFRVTTGTSFRPNGKNRQRKPDSKPTDDWGVRPDPGLEVPLTADLSAELRKQAELHSLRPADSREALAWDDPTADPYRLAALTYLRKQLGPPALAK